MSFPWKYANHLWIFPFCKAPYIDHYVKKTNYNQLDVEVEQPKPVSYLLYNLCDYVRIRESV